MCRNSFREDWRTQIFFPNLPLAARCIEFVRPKLGRWRNITPGRKAMYRCKIAAVWAHECREPAHAGEPHHTYIDSHVVLYIIQLGSTELA